MELGRDGIRVNAIAPDLADTLQTPAAAMLRGRDPALIASWVPLGRFGQPEDYGDVVVFLASEMARFVTGHVIPVDGGTTAASGWYGRPGRRGWTNLPDSPWAQNKGGARGRGTRPDAGRLRAGFGQPTSWSSMPLPSGSLRKACRSVPTVIASLTTDAPVPELADDAVEVLDPEGEVLPAVGGNGGLQQMELLARRVEPRSSDAEVRAVGPAGHAEHIDVEVDGRVDVGDVDPHVVHAEQLHAIPLSRCDRLYRAGRPRSSPASADR